MLLVIIINKSKEIQGLVYLYNKLKSFAIIE